jgi:hypothetical protein
MNIISRCETAEVELFTVIARRIWHRRNAIVHGGEFIHPAQIVKESEIALENFQQANKAEGKPEGVTTNDRAEEWKPPQGNMIKINWDAALDKKRKIIGMGFIARDARGAFLAAGTNFLKLDAEPVMAESIAALYALLFSKEQGYNDVIL